tara:strand:+ start:258 stop:824 length:567 start_codon:yes stop_codon:yes gene_type:complete
MGLDMYLYGTKTFSAYDKQIGNEPVTRTTEFQSLLIETNFENAPIDGTPWSSYTVDYPLAYWCKTNAIHNWFVQNIQNGVDDCDKYYVSAEQLVKLSDLVNKALKRPDIAGTYLPTKSGCFFGGLEYDDWYFDNLRYTKERLDSILSYQSVALADEDRRILHKRLETNVVLMPSKNPTFDGFYYSSSW